MLFTEMGLSPEILQGISELGFVEPTPIQEKVIPLLSEENRDVLGLAQTGTGKTAAFGLPALSKIDLSEVTTQLLILSPTRELCMQIGRDLVNYSKYIPQLKIVSVYGGAPIDKQISSLRKGAQVVVATPGRIRDLIRRKKVNLSNIKMMVLDEADEMLRMGFREEVDEILKETPQSKTTLLFSATMGKDILNIAKTYMNNPAEITIGNKNSSAENVSHIYHMVHARDRYIALKRVVDFYPDIYGIVFCRTRRETKDVAASLMKEGYNAEALHGDLTQSQRDYVMQKFRDHTLSVLVATDVAARGLDVTDLTHVINYNLPDDTENYNHRSGRTGRAGKSGIAVSIINMKEKGKLKLIEKSIKKKFDYLPVPEGKVICERQLFNMIEKVKVSNVNHEQIDPYMEKVYEMLSDFSKEEIIKRFVSEEFNRFLDYYNNAGNINSDTSKASLDNESGSERGKFSRRKKGKSTSRIIFNVGKGKGLNKKDAIDLLVAASGRKDIEIGQIDIFKRASSVEVEEKLAKKVISELNKRSYKGVNIEAEENYEFAGNDFRDRKKDPRGKKKKRQRINS
ncbi:MAG: DEAD/DEAH box helicase [Prolixibacteraceae bacterium]|jgi:ATP-dependent RNA helicase DeaD|nr:DEAD/DEAH box helicase [Prolixibacteraceae bacterium]